MTKWMRIVALALVLPALAACSDDPEGPDEHADEVATIRLTVGAQPFVITSAGAQSGLTIARGATPVTAVFLAADNDTITLGAGHTLKITTRDATRVTYTSTGATSGTLNGLTAGAAIIDVCIDHEGHCDFGAHPVNVTVQ